MDAKDILALFDRPIAFQPIFVDYTGSTNAALMLAQAFYWTKRVRQGTDGWFYKSQDEWASELRLTRREQEGARKLLRATGFWLEQRRGNPAKMYYKIDLEAFHTVAFGKTSVQTRMAENAIYTEEDKILEPPSENGENARTPRALLSDRSETTTQTTARAQLKIPRQPGSDDDLDDKAPKFHYSILKDPSNFGYDIVGVMSQMFPSLAIRGENGLYVQWSGKRIVSRGIGGRPRAKSTLREYAYDLELFLRKCVGNHTNGNGYGNGAKAGSDRPSWMASEK